MVRRMLEESWSEVIEAYQDGRINSERTLQAQLYAHLERRVPKGGVVLCEPTIDLQEIGRVFPDLIVVQGNEVQAAVELKFVPHYFPLFRDDLEKLRSFGRATDRFKLILEPASGRYTVDEYRFSSQCLLVFGAIGQRDAEAIDRDTLMGLMQEHSSRFVPLLFPVG